MPEILTAPTLRTTSFRDPVGRVVLTNGRCFRVMTPQAAAVLEEFLKTDFARAGIKDGKLIDTRTPTEVPDELSMAFLESDWPEALRTKVFEHDLIAFSNYPIEWPAEMFDSAARLTLELAKSVIPLGFSLKDGTPWNVMFRGPKPVFLDMASFERRDPLERVWMPYGQFVRTFLAPLLIWGVTQVPPGDQFRGSRDGLKPTECFRRLGLMRSLRSPALEICAIPTALSSWARKKRKTTAEVRAARARSPEEAEFVLSRLLRRLERALDRVVARAPLGSDWTGYEEEVAAREFAPGYFEAKTIFVTEALDLTRPASCLDLGCNTGHFSLLAAERGAAVVATDNDAPSVGQLYRRARVENQDILPLVIDIARPTPALGWNYSETPSFLDRAERAQFGMVFMLALIHHLCLIERLPLPEVARLAARLAHRWLIVEFVPREDPLANRMPGIWIGESDWSIYDRETFEKTFDRHFSLVRATEVANSGRWIYLMERRAGGNS
jgi:SAM-dependent methyltransferase